jgi:predicted O-linked N-acetylglucosamine transferase (SPINDLY family)
MHGKNFASRVNGGLLKAAKLGSLIAKNEEDYVNKAVDLIRNKSKLESYKRYLDENIRQLPILNSAQKAREIEAAYEFALKRVIEGLPQKNIRFKKIDTK